MKKILKLLYLYAERNGFNKTKIYITIDLNFSGQVSEYLNDEDLYAIFNFESEEDLINKLNN